MLRRGFLAVLDSLFSGLFLFGKTRKPAVVEAKTSTFNTNPTYWFGITEDGKQYRDFRQTGFANRIDSNLDFSEPPLPHGWERKTSSFCCSKEGRWEYYCRDVEV